MPYLLPIKQFHGVKNVKRDIWLSRVHMQTVIVYLSVLFLRNWKQEWNNMIKKRGAEQRLSVNM